MLNRIEEIDRNTSYLVHQTELGILDYLVVIPGLLCSFVGVPFVTIAVFLKFGQHATFVYAGAVIGGFALTTIMKRSTKRVRPSKHGARCVNLRWMESNFSFPSGDSYQAGSLAVFLHACTGNLFFYLIPLFVAFARVYFGFHWIGDTVVGASLGALVTKCTLLRLL